MGRDPDYLEFVRRVAQFVADTPEQTVDEQRAAHSAGLAAMKAPDVPLVVDYPGHGVPARLYHPNPGTPVPGLVFFHGGGFYLGSVAAYDPIARVLVHATGCALVSVEYRLAPEHPFPAAVQDAIAATNHVMAFTEKLCLDPARIGVAGDSAGANLAAVVARHCRSALALQLLVYGVYDLSAPMSPRAPDPDGVVLDRDDFDEIRSRYLGGADARDLDASPLLATDLAGVPPAVVVTAEYDRLAGQGEAYAARLREVGVPVTLIPGEGLDHAFLAWGAFARRPAETIAAIGSAVRAGFGLG
jgi:acetyl esterase